jgi:predicted nucleic-acid-binding Zn-ribbon protein
MRDECLWCEGRNIQEGVLQSTGKVYLKAKNAKFWVWAENAVTVNARVCVDCGYIDLYADTTKLKKLVKPRA